MKQEFPYVDHNDWVNETMGNSCFIGHSKDDLVKLDLFYSVRYPYTFTHDELIPQLINFNVADEDPKPICLQGKYWELIKLDIEEKIADHI